MGLRVVSALVVSLAIAAAPPPTAPRTTSKSVFRSLTIRMPLLRRPSPPVPPSLVEKRGPKCLPASDIAGAAVVAPDTVDFVLRGGPRLRARLDGDCPALGFYGGFYMDRGDDGRICAGRDVIRTRAGGECGIDRFRRLEPAKPGKP